MTTTRSLRDEVQNVLDYLLDAELALYINPVSVAANRVTWTGYDHSSPFIVARQHPTIEQYLQWITTGAYSAVLRDASLLQITYGVAGGKIVSHRLAYIPCPFVVDQALLDDGHPIADIIGLYGDVNDVALRSPIRFDYSVADAKPGHPAAHLTVNSPDCRIACVAPMHVLRFVDFVYRHFYPALWNAHTAFFGVAESRHAGRSEIVDADRRIPHISWDVHATLD